jgi:hypothetical protein
MAGQLRYKVVFLNRGQVFEIYAKSVSQGDLFGFVVVEDLLFGEKSRVLVDPGEESLKNEFSGVKRIMIPLHSVVRIDEVDKAGVSRIAGRAGEDTTVKSFPFPQPDAPTGRGPASD